MSDDLKERLQKHDWRHLTARIEQLEVEKAELHLIYYKEFERAKALEVLHGNEVNRSMELEARASDAEADSLRLLREKQEVFLRAIEAEAQLAAARDLISRPYIGAWADEILIEAAHQRDRFGAEHDTGKAPEDWFWLIGYLAGKALAAHRSGDTEKAHHHTVSTGAVLAHWAAAIDGNENAFRPGIGSEKLVALATAPATDGEKK